MAERCGLSFGISNSCGSGLGGTLDLGAVLSGGVAESLGVTLHFLADLSLGVNVAGLVEWAAN